MSSSYQVVPRKRGLSLRLAAVMAVVFAMLVAPTAQAANATNINIKVPNAYSIAGTIRDNVGAVLPNASIFAYSTIGSGSAQTDSTGKYKILGLVAGSYTVQVLAPSTKNLVDGYYTTANASHFTVAAASATKVAVSPTVPNKTGIDIKLPSGYTITGTITSTGGTPIPNVSVSAFGVSNDSTTTNATGKYTVRGLAAGAYKLAVSPSGNTSYLTGFYSTANANRFVIAPASASNIAVGPNKTANIKIPVGFTISGTITNTTGVALVGVSVRAYTASYSREVATDAAGKYQVKGLAAGNYKLSLGPDSSSVYMDGFFTSANANRFTSSAAGATVLTVGPHKTGVNIKIATGHTISGTITNTAGTPLVDAYITASSGNNYRDASTDAAGKYIIRGLATGSQILSVSPPYGMNLQSGYYTTANTNRFTPAAGSATGIAVGPSKTGINIKLPNGYTIAGKITGPTGAPLDFAFIYATSTNSSGYAFTETDGTYLMIGLSAGSFKVQTYPSLETLQAGYYTTANSSHFTPNPASATNVVIGP